MKKNRNHDAAFKTFVGDGFETRPYMEAVKEEKTVAQMGVNKRPHQSLNYATHGEIHFKTNLEKKEAA